MFCLNFQHMSGIAISFWKRKEDEVKETRLILNEKGIALLFLVVVVIIVLFALLWELRYKNRDDY